MEQVNDDVDEAVTERLDHEMRLIREAVELVAAGASARVVVAGTQFGDILLEPARLLAAAAGVRIVPLWRTDEAGLDIAVEPLG